VTIKAAAVRNTSKQTKTMIEIGSEKRSRMALLE
jgi:hypothetical protein